MATYLKWRDSAQEWLADRVKWVQYPNIRQVERRRTRQPFFRHAMPAGMRVTLTLASLMALAVMIPVMAAAVFFLYAFLGAVFGWIH